MTEPNTPKPVFISYAHEDNESTDRSRRWLDRVTQFLKPLADQDALTICSDKDIGAGDDWHAHIQKHLNAARAAVLLITPAFLASDYVRSSELPILLQNARQHGVRIIPLIVRYSLVEETKFRYPDPKKGPEEFSLASFQAPNSPSTPLSSMTEDQQDEVLLKLARALKRIITATPDELSASSTPRAALESTLERATRSLKSRPELRAEFQEAKGQLAYEMLGKTRVYSFDLWIADAPAETNRVAFEILDETFQEPQWSVARGKKAAPREFLTDDMTSWGDVPILARGTGPGSGNWSLKSSLYEALVRHYGERPSREDIRRALGHIHTR